MTNLHILSDPVTGFWKCPKRGLKKVNLQNFFKQNVSSTFCHQTSSTCHIDTTQSGIWSDPPPGHHPPLLLLYCTVLYCTVLYCTVLYCIILYCTVLYYIALYCTVLYLGAQRAPKYPPEELEVGAHRPPYLLVSYTVHLTPPRFAHIIKTRVMIR